MSEKIFQSKAVPVEENADVKVTTTTSKVSEQGNTIGYCVKCKAKHEMVAPEKIKMKNGKPALKGACEKCNTNIFKIVKKEDAQQ